MTRFEHIIRTASMLGFVVLGALPLVIGLVGRI